MNAPADNAPDPNAQDADDAMIYARIRHAWRDVPDWNHRPTERRIAILATRIINRSSP